jgi:hypothetical protein
MSRCFRSLYIIRRGKYADSRNENKIHSTTEISYLKLFNIQILKEVIVRAVELQTTVIF